MHVLSSGISKVDASRDFNDTINALNSIGYLYNSDCIADYFSRVCSGVRAVSLVGELPSMQESLRLLKAERRVIKDTKLRLDIDLLRLWTTVSFLDEYDLSLSCYLDEYSSESLFFNKLSSYVLRDLFTMSEFSFEDKVLAQISWLESVIGRYIIDMDDELFVCGDVCLPPEFQK
jgi:hypothetical protein